MPLNRAMVARECKEAALQTRRLIGLDPGLRFTGWGIIDVTGNRLRWIADGAVGSDGKADLATRLRELHDGLQAVIDEWRPDAAAVEETFVNRNPVSTLKLGQARGVSLLVAALNDLPVTEFAPNAIKKAVVGTGHADKAQILMMVRTLLPGARIANEHAADALAAAICHAHHQGGGTSRLEEAIRNGR
ncbi:MAG: crossover junction endodeoxyribonuclease RuvC [Pseudomonadota bacterium]|nr:crossover junction endodeoxyribonuclease RuvC [Pseudomonadota bacterium]